VDQLVHLRFRRRDDFRVIVTGIDDGDPLKQSRYVLPSLLVMVVPWARSTSIGSKPATMLVIMYCS